jgi:hypothetical protein
MLEGLAQPDRLHENIPHIEGRCLRAAFALPPRPVTLDSAPSRLALAKLGLISAPYLMPSDSMFVTHMNAGATTYMFTFTSTPRVKPGPLPGLTVTESTLFPLRSLSRSVE